MNSSALNSGQNYLDDVHSRYWVIIPAAGIGKRMEASLSKQYLNLHGKTVLENTLQCFLDLPQINKIVLVLNSNDSIWPTLAIAAHPKIVTVTGAERRCDSVLNGLLYLQDYAKPEDWVLVHDAVRPCLQQSDIEKLMNELVNHPVGGILAAPIRDTLKRTDQDGNILATLERDYVFTALTPQMFRFNKLLVAMQQAVANNAPTDEAAAIEALGEKPLIIKGRSDNIKITYPEDLLLAEKILMSQKNTSTSLPFSFRIGHGYDSHRFITGKKLILGGVIIPYDKGMKAHSDGDVVIHAVCDALLGAAALGDIGRHFPDTAQEFKEIDSRILLKHVVELIKNEKFFIQNIDVTVLADEPKLKPYIEQMRVNLATDLQIDIAKISIKATTNEGMGFVGRGEGIAVNAVALISK